MTFLSTWKTGSLRGRMLLGIGAIMALLGAAVVFALWQMQSLIQQFEHVVEVDTRRAESAQQLHAALLDWGMQQRTLITLTDPDDLKAQRRSVTEAATRYRTTEQILADWPEDTGGAAAQDVLASVKAQLADIRRIRAEVEPVQERALQAVMDGRGVESALALLLPTEAAEQQWRQGIANIVQLITDNNRHTYARVRQHQFFNRNLLMAALAVTLVLGVVIALGLSRSVTRPVLTATRVAQRIADGDLGSDVPIDRQDEVGRLLGAIQTMQAKLREMVDGLRTSAAAITCTSSEIASGSAELSARNEQAATHLQATVSAIRHLHAMVEHSAAASRQASERTAQARAQGRAGGEAVSRVVDGMQALSAATRKIGDIVDVMDGIAFQTNILALNASVEAARAGEQGRGFAVVAAEVRNLAQRAAGAAHQIKDLNAEAALRVEQCSQHVAHAGQTAAQLAGSTTEVADTAQSITAATEQQSGHLREVAMAIHELDALIQQNAAMSEESAAASLGLNQQAQLLSDMVRLFDRASAAQD